MKESTNLRSNFFKNLFEYIKTNYKYFLSFVLAVFIIFSGYQYFSYYQKNNILKNSVSYFNSKTIVPNKEYYEIIKTLSQNDDFYAVISQLEMIEFLFVEKKIEDANKMYSDLLNKNDLNEIYKAAIASHASYKNLNVIYDQSNLNLKSNINEFLEYINDDLDGYIGIKLEIKYLLAVYEQDINSVSTKNDVKTQELYKLIQESENVSSKIKERVNKIHEFQIYK